MKSHLTSHLTTSIVYFCVVINTVFYFNSISILLFISFTIDQSFLYISEPSFSLNFKWHSPSKKIVANKSSNLRYETMLSLKLFKEL